MGNGSGKTAPLPAGASQRVRDFVSCKLDEIAIDTEKLDWVPKGPLGDFAPPITAAPGVLPNSVVLRYGDLGIPVSRTPGGELSADTSNLPESGPLSPIAEGIHEWVDAFNETMKANKKKLRGIQLDGTKVILAKMPAGGADEIDAVDWSKAGQKLVTPVGGGAQPQPKPAAPAPAPKGTNWYDPLVKFWKLLVGFLALLVTIAVVATLLSSGGDDTTVAETSETLSAAGGDSTPSEADTTETEPEPEPEADPQTDTEPEPEPETTPANAGMYEISARVAGPCGNFDVFLRIVLFLNGQMTVDQLLTAGGNPFQSAAGRWDSQMAVATHAEATFFEAWFFLLNLGDILAIYNVTGPSSPVVTPDSQADLADYANVSSPGDLIDVTQASGACATELLDVEATHMPNPESTSG